MTRNESRRSVSRTARKEKAIATTSSHQRTEAEEPVISSFPWPRPDNTPFSPYDDYPWKTEVIPHTTMKEIQKETGYQMYRHGDAWTHHHCHFYNGLLRIEMAPTKFVCEGTLNKMGIRDEVRTMLQRMGLGQIAYQTYPLYPELTRQFLASAELRYEDGAIPAASEGRLSYFSSGILYDISLRELCDLYGFDQAAESCSFPSDFPQAAELWDLIGPGCYESRGAKLTHIRNPVVRVVAKIIGNILFAKEESGALRKDELMLLHFGLPSFIQDIYSTPPPSTLRTNLGAIFAENLVFKKSRGLNTVNKKVERIGSLLTPIFRYHGIDLSSTPCEPKIAYFDEQYFRNSGILKPGFIYQFQDRTGVFRYCKLPLRDFTALTCRANLDFSLPSEFLRPSPSGSRRRGSSSTSIVSQPHLEDDRVPDSPPRHSQFADSTEYILPAYTGEYDLPTLPADATDEDRWTWLIESQQRTHSMMQRMWGALAKIRCPRPPSCFRAAETREDQERTDPAADAPDVAGHRTSDADDTANFPDPAVRLPRRRREPGQSRSVSPDDH